METDHIIRCMLYPINKGFPSSNNNVAVFLTELLYRDDAAQRYDKDLLTTVKHEYNEK
jgi:hypothetical protein